MAFRSNASVCKNLPTNTRHVGLNHPVPHPVVPDTFTQLRQINCGRDDLVLGTMAGVLIDTRDGLGWRSRCCEDVYLLKKAMWVSTCPNAYPPEECLEHRG